MRFSWSRSAAFGAAALLQIDGEEAGIVLDMYALLFADPAHLGIYSASISLGHPLAIDLTDCDGEWSCTRNRGRRYTCSRSVWCSMFAVRLPSPFEILKHPTDLPSDPSKGDRPFAFNTEMLKLSILFGRVMRTIYSPTGLMKATDAEITALLDDIDRWRGGLASELQFKGPDSDAHSGTCRAFEIDLSSKRHGLTFSASCLFLLGCRHLARSICLSADALLARFHAHFLHVSSAPDIQLDDRADDRAHSIQ